MKNLIKEIKAYKENNSLQNEECAKLFQISPQDLVEIESGNVKLDESEIKRLHCLMQEKAKNTGRRVRKILDLFFRFGASIMALVVLLLCINGYAETNTLIALLSIGVVCSSLTILPKIEK